MRITKLTLLTLFGTLILVLSSCERDANFNVQDGESKLHVISEITVSEKIKVFIKTSVGANTEDEFLYPKQGEAKVTLFEEGIRLDNPGFRYDTHSKAFVSQGSFRPAVGKEYNLEVSLSDNNIIKPIFGTTMIPEADSLANVKVYNKESNFLASDQKSVSFNVNIDLGGTKNDYFLLKFEGKVNGDSFPLEIKEVLKGKDGIYFSKYLDGFFIDKNDLTGNNIELNLETLEVLRLDEEIENLDFELRTITKEAHQFYVAYSKQVISEGVAISEPVISFTNFESGLGLFSGYSTSFYQVEM